jgi:hypothetical protein
MKKSTFFKTSMLLILLCFLLSGTHAQEKETLASSYLFPEFIKGTVLMKNGIRHVAMLNYNMLTQEMNFDQNGTKMALNVSDPIDTVYIEKHKFVLLKKTFVELIYDSKFSLYIETKCKMADPGTPAAYGGTSQTSSTTRYSTYYSQGKAYNLKMPQVKVTEPFFEYWLKKDKKINKFFSINHLAKLYKDKNEQFNEYMEKHEVKFEDPLSILEFIRYLESN